MPERVYGPVVSVLPEVCLHLQPFLGTDDIPFHQLIEVLKPQVVFSIFELATGWSGRSFPMNTTLGLIKNQILCRELLKYKSNPWQKK